MYSDIGTIQGILTVLEENNFTGTNKLGLLLSLIDLAPHIKDDKLSIDIVSLKLLEIHWSHSEKYTASGLELKQTQGANSNTTVIN